MAKLTEFRVFVEHTEKQLFALFQSIDRDHNGNLDKEELRAAFKKVGLIVPSRKLDQFFSEVDTNHDGVISFDEWR
jgi:solute carrier family 25 phosphate transporter 23/24/25/41